MLSTLLSAVMMKCPKCHKGKLFINQNPYNLKMISKMPKTCSCCDQVFEPEPGFYYGAMYLSYIICVGVCAINYFLVDYMLHIEGIRFLMVNTLILILLWPVIFRYARVSLIYLVVSYDPNACKKPN